LANRVRQEKLAQCRALLGHTARPLAQEATVDREVPAVPSGEPGARCPVCQHGRMQLVQTLYRQQAAWDLSAPMPGCDTSQRRQARQTPLVSSTADLCTAWRGVVRL
jgi:hypothetical protein